MSRLQESLRSFLTVEGVRTATVIDVATGMIIRSVGQADQDLPTTAACVADEAKTVRGALSADHPADDLVEIATVTDNRLQVATMLRSAPGRRPGAVHRRGAGRSPTWACVKRAISRLAPAVLA